MSRKTTKKNKRATTKDLKPAANLELALDDDWPVGRFPVYRMVECGTLVVMTVDATHWMMVNAGVCRRCAAEKRGNVRWLQAVRTEAHSWGYRVEAQWKEETQTALRRNRPELAGQYGRMEGPAMRRLISYEYLRELLEGGLAQRELHRMQRECWKKHGRK